MDWTALGRRAVACKGWRWLPGMHERCHGWEWRLYKSGDGLSWVDAEGQSRPLEPHKDFPDLSDPATVGCLLQLVREAHDRPMLFTAPTSNESWGVWDSCDLLSGHGACCDTEAEALVAALEAAP